MLLMCLRIISNNQIIWFILILNRHRLFFCLISTFDFSFLVHFADNFVLLPTKLWMQDLFLQCSIVLFTEVNVGKCLKWNHTSSSDGEFFLCVCVSVCCRAQVWQRCSPWQQLTPTLGRLSQRFRMWKPSTSTSWAVLCLCSWPCSNMPL